MASISGCLAIEKTEGYQDLLDYWSGSAAAPSAEEATEILMDLTEKLKFENCRFQPDVADAMFRQVQTDETIPYGGEMRTVPGVVHATDFDMGVVGSAYGDVQVANYHVSTGNYTEWNSGWQYRNDGVDITFSNDPVFDNGYKVSWLASDEWMKYTVDVTSGGALRHQNAGFRGRDTGPGPLRGGRCGCVALRGVHHLRGGWRLADGHHRGCVP